MAQIPASRSPARAPGPRWWPAASIAVLSLGGLLWLWLQGATSRQDQVLTTLGIVAFAAVLLVVWLLFFSRLRARTRGITLAVGLLLAAFFGTLVEVRGVSGDLVPLLAWRWSSRGGGSGVGSDGAIRQTSSASTLSATRDFPQFLGPQRDATIHDLHLARDWQARPPKELWRRPVGAAWSGFAVVGDRAVTQEQWSDEEAVTAYDLGTGERVWSHTQPAHYETSLGGVGPRATPTVADGRVYAVGATGILSCLDLASGSEIWSHDLPAEHGLSGPPEWGKSGSPLLIDGRVVVTVGGIGKALVAYDATTGEELWSAGNDFSAYSSPMVAALGGLRQIVVFNDASVTGHALEDGTVLWRYPWASGQPNVAQPLMLGDDKLLISTGYGVGSHLVQVAPAGDGWSAKTLWESPRLKLKFSQAVEHDGFVYGLDDGVLVCLDPATGERRWKKGRYGHGQILLVEDLLLLQTEDGELLLIEPHPDALRELGRIPVLEGRAWNTLALAGPLLLVRNDREAACYQLPLRNA